MSTAPRGFSGRRLMRIRCAASVRSAGYGRMACSSGIGGATMATCTSEQAATQT